MSSCTHGPPARRVLEPGRHADVHQTSAMDRPGARQLDAGGGLRRTRATGDTEDGQLIVYYFGGTGGSVEANLQRWTSQFQSSKEPTRTTSTVNGRR